MVVEPSDVDGMVDVLNPEYKSSPVVLLLNDDNGSEDPDPVDVLYGDASRFQAIFHALPVPAQKMVTAYLTFQDGKTADRGKEPQNNRLGFSVGRLSHLTVTTTVSLTKQS